MKSLVLTLKPEEHLKKRNILFKYFLYLFFYLIVFLFFISPSFGQCEMKFEYEVVHCSEGKDDGKIFIKSIKSPSRITIKVVDAFLDKLIETKENLSVSANSGITLNNLPPSTYIVYVMATDCKPRTLGGINGIVIGNKE